MNKGWSSFMDRRVKERLVGATILVVLVVLIVPELLSGPKRAVVVPQTAFSDTADAIRSVTVDLATDKATAATEEAASAVSDPAAPGGASSSDTVASKATDGDAALPDSTSSTAATAVAPGAATPTAAATAAVASTAAGSAVTPLQAQQPGSALAQHPGWAAQVGSFAARDNAQKLERQLHAQGFAPFLSATGAGQALRYRVRVGPVADRAAAEKLRTRLKKAGHQSSVVAP